MNDLPTLDAELYRSLMFLRDYDGDAADLALTFSIVDDDLGTNHEARREQPIRFTEPTTCGEGKLQAQFTARICK